MSLRRFTLLAALACAACAGGGPADGTLTLAVIPKGTSHTFWQHVHAGAEKAAQELGVERTRSRVAWTVSRSRRSTTLRS
jgi:ribose transport system substrate-binding protein